jgi:hypothetical protein
MEQLATPDCTWTDPQPLISAPLSVNRTVPLPLPGLGEIVTYRVTPLGCP